MSHALRAGLERTETLCVDRARTIDFLGEVNRVYSTPSMVNDVEYACWRLIQAHLQPGQTSLGVEVSMQHLASTPVGEQVTIRVRVESVQGRRIHLSAQVRDAVCVVGQGEHRRAVVNRDRYAAHLAARRGDAAGPAKQ